MGEVIEGDDSVVRRRGLRCMSIEIGEDCDENQQPKGTVFFALNGFDGISVGKSFDELEINQLIDSLIKVRNKVFKAQ